MHDLCALLNPILVESANPNQAIGYLAAETSARSLHPRRSDFSTFGRAFFIELADATRRDRLDERDDPPISFFPLLPSFLEGE